MNEIAARVSRPATYQDVLDAPADMVAEIAAGTLHLHPRPASRHALAAFGLAGFLNDPFRRGVGGPGGWWLAVEPELHLGPDVLVPDLCGWRRERMPEFPDAPAVDGRAGLGLRDPEPGHAAVRHDREARPLRRERGRTAVAPRSGGADAGGVRAARRGLGAGRGGEGRGRGALPAVRCDRVSVVGVVGGLDPAGFDPTPATTSLPISSSATLDATFPLPACLPKILRTVAS